MANEGKDKAIGEVPPILPITPSGIISRPSGIIHESLSLKRNERLRSSMLAEVRAKLLPWETGFNLNQIQIVLAFPGALGVPLTPYSLSDIVVPYLSAIAELQYIIDEIKGRTPQLIIVREISQNSPITLNLQGGAEAVEVIKETVVPWRKKHAEKMAKFQEKEKQIEIEAKKAEVLEKRAQVAKDNAEAEKIVAEAYCLRQEAEKVRLENEKLRLELYNAQIELALNALALIAPNLTETEKIAYVVKLLQPLGILAASELQPLVAQIEKP